MALFSSWDSGHKLKMEKDLMVLRIGIRDVQNIFSGVLDKNYLFELPIELL